jgi:hypothetical protein
VIRGAAGSHGGGRRLMLRRTAENGMSPRLTAQASTIVALLAFADALA